MAKRIPRPTVDSDPDEWVAFYMRRRNQAYRRRSEAMKFEERAAQRYNAHRYCCGGPFCEFHHAAFWLRQAKFWRFRAEQALSDARHWTEAARTLC